MKLAALVGSNRHLIAMAKGRSPQMEFAGTTGWGVDIEGAAAELAVAKALGVYWSGQDTPDCDGDIRAGEQVRHTERPNGCLIVHKKNADDHKFYLVTGIMPTMNVVGWIMGRDAKQEQWWRTNVPKPAYFVPQSALIPFGVAAKNAA